MHGALGDYRDWTAQIAPLAAHFRVIAYSRRYHYPNPWTGDGLDYTLERNAADLVAIVQALHLPPVHVVGHSYGGSVAAMAESQRLSWAVTGMRSGGSTTIAQ